MQIMTQTEIKDGIDPNKEITIKCVSGVEGDSIYLNDTRIAGPKPWGGGHILWEKKTTIRDIELAIGFFFSKEVCNCINRYKGIE